MSNNKLVELIENAVIEDIGDFSGYGGFSHYARNNPELRRLYDDKVITDDIIEKGLEKYCLNKAKEQYAKIINFQKTYPSRSFAGISFPEYVVYGIQKGIFTEKELEDLSLNLDDFQKTYGVSNLVSFLKADLLNPKPLPKLDDIDCHCFDCMR